MADVKDYSAQVLQALIDYPKDKRQSIETALSKYSKQVSIAFAEWILENGYYKDENNPSLWTETTSIFENLCYPSEELFDMFIQQYKP